jgi:hypothetical protein
MSPFFIPILLGALKETMMFGDFKVILRVFA